MDFDKFADGTSEVDPRDLLALYKTLDPKRSHVELRDSQIEVIKLWADHRDQRDLVIKLATGAGKTTLGLLILYSHMVETRKPCLFLCPTNQLVGQVVDEGRLCGVPCCAFRPS
jgi:superfamily II DNA or RNA helicase